MKRLYLLTCLCSVVIITACGANVENQEVEENQVVMEIEETDLPEEISDEEELVDKGEEDIGQIGHYTLEECNNPGIYVLMEDGSFEKYQGGMF